MMQKRLYQKSILQKHLEQGKVVKHAGTGQAAEGKTAIGLYIHEAIDEHRAIHTRG